MNTVFKRSATAAATTARRYSTGSPLDSVASEQASKTRLGGWLVSLSTPPQPGRPSMPEGGFTGTWVDSVADNLGGQLVESGALIPPQQLKSSRKQAMEQLASEAPAYRAAEAIAKVCPITKGVMEWSEPICTAPASQVKFGWPHPDDTMWPRGWLDYHRSVAWGLSY